MCERKTGAVGDGGKMSKRWDREKYRNGMETNKSDGR